MDGASYQRMNMAMPPNNLMLAQLQQYNQQPGFSSQPQVGMRLSGRPISSLTPGPASAQVPASASAPVPPPMPPPSILTYNHSSLSSWPSHGHKYTTKKQQNSHYRTKAYKPYMLSLGKTTFSRSLSIKALMFDKLRRLTKQLPEFQSEINSLDQAMDQILERIGSSKVEIPVANSSSRVSTSGHGSSMNQKGPAADQPLTIAKISKKPKRTAIMQKQSGDSAPAAIDSVHEKFKKSRKLKSGAEVDSIQSRSQSRNDPTDERDEGKNVRYVGKCPHFKGTKYFFSSAVVKGQVVRKGDTVLLQNAEPDEKPYICLINDIWHNRRTGEAMMRGAWFYRLSDIPRNQIKGRPSNKQKRDRKQADDKLYLSNECNTNSLESVLKRVAVIYSDDSSDTVTAKREWAARHGSEIYFCEELFRPRSGRFLDYKHDLNSVKEQLQMTAEEEAQTVETSTLDPDISDACEIISPSLSKVIESSSKSSLPAWQDDEISPPLLGLERRHTAAYLDPDAGKYNFSILGGTSFRVDGSIILQRTSVTDKIRRPPKKRARTSPSSNKRKRGAEDATNMISDWHQKACRLLEDMENHRLVGSNNTHVETAAPFLVPVKKVIDEVPAYAETILNPIDFLQIRADLGMGSTIDTAEKGKYDVHQKKSYSSFEEFKTDVDLVFSNCMTFNVSKEAYEIRSMCRALQYYFETAVNAITKGTTSSQGASR